MLPTDSKRIRESIMIHNVILHSSVLMKKDILENVGGYNPAFRGSEDYELWLRMISKGYSLGNCPMYLLYLRESPESITRGTKWFENRVGYVKSKGYACSKYGYLSPVDISCFPFLCFFNSAPFNVSIGKKGPSNIQRRTFRNR